MKRKYKIIISTMILIFFTTISIMYTSYHINHIPVNLHILTILLIIVLYTLLYIICTNFSKNRLIDVLKNNPISTLASITIILLSFYFASPLTIKLLEHKHYEKNTTNHGSAYLVKKEDLYTFDDVINPFFSYNKYQADAKDGIYSKAFDKENIIDVHISIDRNNFNYLLQNAINKPSVMANKIQIGNYTLNYPSIKTKGLTSLNEIWKSSNDRFSFTIDFSKNINKDNNYKEDQNLYGIKKISFNNMMGDPTMMKEYLSYYLLTEMGVPTPEYGLANLHINDRYYGVYFMIEPIEDELIERTLKEENETDFLFKVEANGGELIYRNELDNYIDENGEFNFDEIIYDENGKLVYPSNNILYHYNGLWENDEKKFKKIVDNLPKVFKNIKILNDLSKLQNKNTPEYEQQLNEIIDTDLLARYWAANVYLVNSDSYISRVKTNYALYLTQNGKFAIIPWDYNFSFGAHHLRKTNQIINLNIYNPTIESSLEESPLINVILGNDNLRKLYEKYLNDCTIIASYGGTTSNQKSYPKNNFINIIDKRIPTIIKNQQKDIQSFYDTNQINTASDNLKELITLRSKAIQNQLNGDFTQIESDIPYNSLGGLISVLNQEWNTKKRYNK